MSVTSANNVGAHPPDSSASGPIKGQIDCTTDSPLLSEKECLIETTVEYAYCLPRGTKDAIIKSLEKAWNMERGTLDVETRCNIFQAGTLIHRSFDDEKWFFLPEPHIIEAYHAVRNQPALFPEISEQSYKYQLIAHPDMALVPCHRHPSSQETPFTDSDRTLFGYPFTSCTVTTHVHPRFAIYNAGYKLTDGISVASYCEGNPQLISFIKKVLEVYMAWTKPSGRSRANGVSDDNQGGIDDGTVTPPRRVFPPGSRTQHRRRRDNISYDDDGGVDDGAVTPPRRVFPPGSRTQHKRRRDNISYDDDGGVDDGAVTPPRRVFPQQRKNKTQAPHIE